MRDKMIDQDILKDLTESYLKVIIANACDSIEEEFDSFAPFGELGLNSFDVLKIIKNLEADFGSLPKTLLFENFNVDDLSQYFIRKHEKTILDKFANDGETVVNKETIKNTSLETKKHVPQSNSKELTPKDGENRLNGKSKLPSILLESELKSHPTLNTAVTEAFEKYKNETSVSRGTRNIAPFLFVGSEKRGYFNFSRSNNLILVYAYTGPDDYLDEISEEFMLYCETHNFEFNMFSDSRINSIGDNAFSATPFGVVQKVHNLQGFTLQGGKMRRLRYQVSKFEKSGKAKTVEYMTGSDGSTDNDIAEIIDQWCESRTMVNPLIYMVKEEILAGKLSNQHRLFLTYLDEKLQNVILISSMSSEDNGYLMDLEFYPKDMPLGGLEFAIVNMIEILVSEGCNLLSLGGTYGCKLEESENADPHLDKMLNDLREQNIFNDDGNLQFKNKFRPDNKTIFLCRPLEQKSADNVIEIIMMIAEPPTIDAKNSEFPRPKKHTHKVTETGYMTENMIEKEVHSLSKKDDLILEGNSNKYLKELNECDFNPINLPATNVVLDLKTDSWAQLSNTIIDSESQRLHGLLQHPIDINHSLRQAFPFSHFALCQSGRDAENILCKAWDKKGIVLQNLLFPTWIFSQIENGFSPKEIPSSDVFNLDSEYLYKSNIEIERVTQQLDQYQERISFLCLEVSDNAVGGLPISIAHLKELNSVLKRFSIPLVIDATRVIENAHFITENEHQYENVAVWDIVQEILSFADVITVSLAKDFSLSKGGLIATNDEKLYHKIQNVINQQGGGLDIIDKKIVAHALANQKKVEMTTLKRLQNVKKIWHALKASGIPVVSPAGGHCILIDLKQITSFQAVKNPVASFIAWLYLNTGIRAGEHSVGMQQGTSLNQLIRLAIPVGITQVNVTKTIDKLVTAFQKIQNIPELELVDQQAEAFGTIHTKYRLLKIHNHTNQYPALGSDEVNPSESVESDSAQVSRPDADSFDSEVLSESTSNQMTPEMNINKPLDIAIIGMAGRYPKSTNMNEFWQNLVDGQDCISEISDDRFSRRRQSPAAGKYRAGFIDDIDKFDSMFFNIAPREAETLDPQERLFLEVAWETLEDAGYYPETLTNRNGENKVGVFVGAVWAMYQTIGAEERFAGNEQAIASSFLWSIANRVSYCMNFTGPSMAVDTACSASLTALYLAIDSIKKGECSEAIVGGVNLDVHQCKQEITVAGGLLSEDGYCRTFGKGASGYVPGEGVGAVLIKPLKKALQDRDNIYGVVKSVAINHGGKTSGFSVPNPKAQCELVKTALKTAQIDARTLGYIEAHGTGTELGDPVEITGLRNAFEEYDVANQSCSIGSIKTNIGHLEAAAGLVGLCKVLLQMRHQKLVPSLHSSSLNEFIDFEDSPFTVQQDVMDWHGKSVDGVDYPLRAGVSSFGAGGSNAHIILEAVHNTQSESTAATVLSEQIIPLSARNEEQLRNAAERLKEFLENTNNDSTLASQVKLENVAYTLQIGRKSFDHRLVVVAKTKRQLIERLEDYIENKKDENVLSGSVKNNEGITKLLSRKEKQQFIELVSQGRDSHKIAQLWIDGLLSDWQGMCEQLNSHKISLPTYPFADKRHWIARNESKDNVSINILGSDIRLAKHPMIDTNESTFERQIFKKTFTEHEFFIYDHLVSDIPTLPGVGYLDFVRKAGEIAAGRKIQKIINILWVSPLTVEDSNPTEAFVELKPNGQVVQFEVFSEKEDGKKQLYAQGKLAYATTEDLEAEDEFVDIDSIRERCQKVIDGKDAYPLFKSLGLHLGPSFQVLQEVHKNDKEVLGSLEISEIANSRFQDYVLHPSLVDGSFQALMGAKLGDADDGEMVVPYSLGEVEILHPLTKKCFSYVTEASESAKAGSGLSKKNVLILDENGKVLVRVKDSVGVALTDVHEKPSQNSQTEDEFSKLYYETVWEECSLIDVVEDNQKLPALLLFDSDEVLRNLYMEKIDLVGGDKSQIVLVKPGKQFVKVNAHCYEINPKKSEDYQKLIESLLEDDWNITNICFAWPSIDSLAVKPKSKDKAFEHQLEHSVYAFLNLSKTLVEKKIDSQVRLQYLFLTDENNSKPLDQAINGFAQILSAENQKLDCQILQVEQKLANKNSYVLDTILAEIQAKNKFDFSVKYDLKQRFIRKIKNFELSIYESQTDQTHIRTKGIYLITGGAGGLGFIFAEYLAREYCARLVLTGRSKLTNEQEEKLKEMRASGAEVVYFSGDISKFKDVERIIKQTKSLYGGINGIIHSAGVLRDAYVRNKTVEEMKAVFAPKLYGTLHLDQVTAADKLDFFVTFSSLAALAGNAGQSDYSFANHFMDSFMESRNKLVDEGDRFGKSLSLNWSIWADGGMQLDEQTAIFFEKNLGIKSLSKQTGIDTFVRGLASEKSKFAIIEGIQDKIERAWGIIEEEFDETADQTSKPESNASSGKTTSDDSDDLTLAVQKALSNIVMDFLKLDEEDIDLDTILLDLGYDSIGLTTFANSVNDIYGTDVTPVTFFEYPNIREIANFLATEHQDQASQAHNTSTSASQGNTTPARNIQSNGESELSNTAITISKGWNPQANANPQVNMDSNLFSAELRFVQQPIAIVGMSGVMPQSDDLDEYWEKLRNAENNMVTEIPADRWDWREYYGDPLKEENKTKSKWGGFMREVDKFDPLFWGISPLEAEMMDPQQRIFLESVWGAVEDSGQRVSELAGTKTGLFVGASTRDYIDLMADEKAELNGYSASGTSHAVLANRVSFLLGLHGPSAPLDTACSSSLVALHRAIESIHTGSSDMAIVGGVQVMLTPAAFISFGAAGMLAEDGKCKTFDERGDGYVRGEGSGAIFIKPLAMAEADGNSIYAIIKATAENHGGKATMLTAPNPQAQSELLVEAYEKAQIDPTTVGYLECHGTGTSLGDPIEIQAMKKAFAELYKIHNKPLPKEPHIGLTSVKTNIGHLETAAGIAGILKVLLSIKNREIPALLHFEKQNPFIKLEDTPFYLVDKTRPWKAINDEKGKPLPLRAGVSSFGFGGANAHIILEEYVTSDNQPKPDSEGEQVFLLSAKSAERLTVYADKMLSHFKRHQNRLIDITYTSQVGRDEMKDRLAVVVSSLSELTEKLQAFVQGKRNIQGLYLGHADAKSSAKDVDKNQITEWLNNSQTEELANAWVKGVSINWIELYNQQKPLRLSLPTYPFARQRCWFSSPQNKPNGIESVITNLPSKISQLHPLVHQNTSTLSEQKFTSHFDGHEFFLSDHVGGGDKLLPGVAYMEMIRAAGELAGEKPVRKLRNIVWMRPLVVDESQDVEILLTPKGNEVSFEVRNSTQSEAITLCTGELTYESAGLNVETVDIESIRTRCPTPVLSKQELYSYILNQGLELGSGFQVTESLFANENEALSILALPQHLKDESNQYWLHPALMDGTVHSTMVGLVIKSKSNISLGVPFSVAEVQIFDSLDKLYYGYATWADEKSKASQGTIKLNQYLLDKTGKVLVKIQGFVGKTLPKIETVASQSKVNHSNAVAAMKDEEKLNALVPVWTPLPSDIYRQNEHSNKSSVLVLTDDANQYEWIKHSYPQAKWLDVKLSASIEVISQELNNSKFEHLVWIAPDVKVDQNVALDSDIDLISIQDSGVISVYRIAKALSEVGKTNVDLEWTIITSRTQRLNENDSMQPAHAGVSGLVGSMAKEFPSWDLRLLDLDSLNNISGKLCLELPCDKQGNSYVYRRGDWYTQSLAQLEKIQELPTIYKQRGVYVVIGGAGGLGEVWSRLMIEHYDAKVVWIGRRVLDEKIKLKISNLSEIGFPPRYIQADATDHSSLQQALHSILEQYSEINGVIQSAIVLRDESILELEEADFKTTLSAKVDVSVNMDKVFGGLPLDFMLFFSSIISFMKTPRQSNYAAGCTFKDSFAQSLQSKYSYPIKTINWGYWGNVGIVADESYQKVMQQMGVGSIESDEGMHALECLLSSDINHMALMKTLNRQALGAVSLAEVVSYPKQIKESPLITLEVSLMQNLKDNASLQKQLVNLDEEIPKPEMVSLINEILAASLLKTGLLKNSRSKLSEITTTNAPADFYEKWLSRSIAYLKSQNVLKADLIFNSQPRSLDVLWKEWEAKKTVWAANDNQQAQFVLLEACLNELPAILTGAKPATSVMFPNSSMALVEGIYRDNVIADYFNEVLGETLTAAIEKQLKTNNGESIRILEIGAGTGGTTAKLLPLLDNYDIEEYCYTDLSKAFLMYAEEHFQEQYPMIKTEIFDVSKPLHQQSISLKNYDVVIATNVLHATPNIRETLRNTKATLKAGGILLLNEISNWSFYTHLTFGLLEGWWLHQDTNLRIPGNPGLESSTWSRILSEEGYDKTIFPAESAHKFGQQIIVSSSNGISRQALTKAVPESVEKQTLKASPHASSSKNQSISNVLDYSQTGESHVGDVVIDKLAESLKMDRALIQNEASFFDYGVDSIVGVSLIRAISDALHIELETTVLFENNTVDQLSSFIWNNWQDKIVTQIEVKSNESQTQLATQVALPDIQKSPEISVHQYVKDIVVDSLSSSLKIEPSIITNEASFFDYGVDSIVGVSLIRQINESLHIELETTVLFENSTVNQLADLIVNQWEESISQQLAISIPSASIDNTATLMNKLPEEQSTPIVNSRFNRESESYTALDIAGENNYDTRVKPIAIIGMSGKVASSESLVDFWTSLKEGKSLVEEISRWQEKDCVGENYSEEKYCTSAGFISNVELFDAEFFRIPEQDAIYMCPQQRLFLEESWKAFEDAGYTTNHINGKRCGVYVGCAESEYASLMHQPPAQAFWGNSESMIAARVAYFLNLQGPAVAVDTACSSSLVAIHLACQALWLGEVEMAIAGGVSLQVSSGYYQMANLAGMLSKKGRCFSFDNRADGFVPAESVGAILLKTLPDAVREGDNIHAVIKGIAVNQDGTSNGITSPNATSQENLQNAVYERFNIDPENIQLVEAHGTGTQLGDIIEFNALNRSFRKHTQSKQYCALGSVKTNVGHAGAAAGLTGLFKLVLSLTYRQIPASLNYIPDNQSIDSENSPFYVNTEHSDWNVESGKTRMAALSSFGFSGTNAHLVIEEAPQSLDSSYRQQPGYLMVLSADSEQQLKEYVAHTVNWLNAAKENDGITMSINDICYTLLTGRSHRKYRLASIVGDLDEFNVLLSTWARTGIAKGALTGVISDEGLHERVSLRKFGEHCIEQCRSGIASNEFLDNLETITDLYLQGYQLDYTKLCDVSSRRVSLPTVPLSPERFWVRSEAESLALMRSNAIAIHPLLEKVDSDSIAPHFLVRFDKSESIFERHQFEENFIVSASVYLELISAAVLNVFPKQPNTEYLELYNVIWCESMTIDENSLVTIKLNSHNTSDKTADLVDIEFEVIHANKVYCQGKALRRPLPKIVEIDVENLKSNLILEEKGKDKIKGLLSQKELELYSISDSIFALYSGSREILIELELPNQFESSFESYILHPVLLDNVLSSSLFFTQMGATLLYQPFSPNSVESIKVLSKFTQKMSAWIRYSSEGSSDKIVKLDVDMFDEEKKLCLQLRGLTYFKLSAGLHDEKQNSWRFHAADLIEESSVSRLVSFSNVDKIILMMKQELFYQLQISMEKIDTRGTFFDLGADSIVMTALLGNINRLLETSIQPSIVFEYASIDSLANYIATNYSEKVSCIGVEKLSLIGDYESYINTGKTSVVSTGDDFTQGENIEGANNYNPKELLVAMQSSGKGEPIYAMPGVGGSVLTLQAFALAFSGHNPFFGLQTVNVDNQVFAFDSIEEMAKANITSIKTHQPEGPYHILGYSFGGVVAYEVARELAAQGDKVATLTLVDTLVPTLFDGLNAHDEATMLFEIYQTAMRLLGASLELAELQKIPVRERSKYILSQLSEQGVEISNEQAELLKVIEKNGVCQSNYKPGKLSKNTQVTLFRGTERHAEMQALPEDYGWNEFVSSNVRVFDYKANHSSIMNPKNAPKIAKKVQQIINKKEKATS